MKIILLSIGIFIIPYFSYSQITFERTYGSSGVDQGEIVKQLTDSTYILMGTANGYGNNSYSSNGMLLAKINSLGDTLWTKSYGGLLRSGIKTNDSGYLLVGNNTVKTDSNGDTLWTSDIVKGYGAVETVDHDYIICGIIYNPTNQSSDLCLVKLNTNGDTLWEKSFGTNAAEVPQSIIPTSDSNYMIAIWRTYAEPNKTNIWLLKINKNGDIIKDIVIDSETSELCSEIHETADSGFAIIGYYTAGTGAFLIKTDKNGMPLWEKPFEGTNYGRSIDLTYDGGYIVSCYSSAYGDSEGDMMLIKTDNAGDVLWYKVFGGLKYDNPAKIIQAYDSTYIVIGQTQSYGAGSTDIYLIKTDKMGSVDSTINELDYKINSTKPTNKKTCDGTISINVRGGRPPYSYKLNNVDTLNNINNLCDEIYSVSINDQYDNQVNESISLLIEKIDSILVIPEKPTNIDNIKLDIYSKINCTDYESDLQINSNNIIVTLTYTGGYLNSIQQVNAETQLGKLSAGDYTVKTYLRIKYWDDWEMQYDSIIYDSVQFSMKVSETSSIDKYLLQNSIRICPNPITDNSIVISDSQYAVKPQMIIYNTSGQEIFNKKTYLNNLNIGRYINSRGFYYYVIYNDQNIIGAGKLIKE